MFIVFSALEQSEKKVKETHKQDCFSCRVIGFATCLALSGFCFTEAFRLYPGVKADRSIVRMPPSNPKSPTPMPSIKSRSNHVFNVSPTPKIPSNVRLRFYSFMILGTGTSFAGIYRLMM